MKRYKQWLERYAVARGISEAEAAGHLQAKTTKEFYEREECEEKEAAAVDSRIKGAKDDIS